MANTTHKPLGDLAYDLITVLHRKAKDLEAIERYIQDARDDDEALRLLERIRKEDEEQIEDIKRCVLRCLENDGLWRSGAV
jgi:hypothetical protein